MRKQEGMSILSLHPGAKAGCSIGGKCEKCPLYRFVEVDHPQTGEKVREWDCIFVWQVMWQGDTSRQVIGAHDAVAQQTNEQVKRQEEGLRRQDDFFDVLAQGLISHVDTRLAQISDRLALSLLPPEQQGQQHLSYSEPGSGAQSPGEFDEGPRPNGQ